MLKYILARFRLNKRYVCELSKGKGLYDDYHDYPDTKDKFPLHLANLNCERCGKEFRI